MVNHLPKVRVCYRELSFGLEIFIKLENKQQNGRLLNNFNFLNLLLENNARVSADITFFGMLKNPKTYFFVKQLRHSNKI